MSALHLNINNEIAELRLDNVDKLNCLTVSMLEALDSHCNTLEKNPDVRVVLLTAEGDHVFCAGADISAWGDLAPFDFSRDWIRHGHRVFNRLARLVQPTIAVVKGHAIGGGLELITACDLRVSSPTATFGMPETSIGVVPGWSGTQRLARHLPPAILKEMTLFGSRLTAKRVYEIGFINMISDDPYATAFEMAEQILNKSPRANEVTKYMLNAAHNEDTEAMIEALGGGMISSTKDKAEGVLSFREKRKPDFSEK